MIMKLNERNELPRKGKKKNVYTLGSVATGILIIFLIAILLLPLMSTGM